jgi:hypothetical protein
MEKSPKAPWLWAQRVGHVKLPNLLGKVALLPCARSSRIEGFIKKVSLGLLAGRLAVTTRVMLYGDGHLFCLRDSGGRALGA